MAFTINMPKSALLKPFFIMLVIIVAPFALLFGLARLPFERHRLKRLPEIIAQDWLPRQKYIYIGISTSHPLADWMKKNILTDYGEHIVWDEWDTVRNIWKRSEPDTFHRVTAFWQDIGGDFDGDPMIILATYSPNDVIISRNHNFHQFWPYEDDNSLVAYKGDDIVVEEAGRKIQRIIQNTIAMWDEHKKSP